MWKWNIEINKYEQTGSSEAITVELDGDKEHHQFAISLATHTHTHNHFTALWNLSGTTRVSRYQKKRSPSLANSQENMLTSFEVSTRLQHVPPYWALEVLYCLTRSSAETLHDAPQIRKSHLKMLAIEEGPSRALQDHYYQIGHIRVSFPVSGLLLQRLNEHRFRDITDFVWFFQCRPTWLPVTLTGPSHLTKKFKSQTTGAF